MNVHVHGEKFIRHLEQEREKNIKRFARLARAVAKGAGRVFE